MILPSNKSRTFPRTLLKIMYVPFVGGDIVYVLSNVKSEGPEGLEMLLKLDEWSCGPYTVYMLLKKGHASDSLRKDSF